MDGTETQGALSPEPVSLSLPAADTVYTVLRLLPDAQSSTGVGLRVFEEVGTAKLPSRARRNGAVFPAMRDAKLDVVAGQKFLVLDERNAEELPVKERPQPPAEERLVVG